MSCSLGVQVLLICTATRLATLLTLYDFDLPATINVSVVTQQKFISSGS
jgi:hypothetical protein